MATAVPLLLAWAGVYRLYRSYFDADPYPVTPILISWIAGGAIWWLLDRGKLGFTSARALNDHGAKGRIR